MDWGSVLLGLMAALPARSTEFRVTVGANGILRYDPQTVTAVPGDSVIFEFHPKNHTVTRSTFEKPCFPAQSENFTSGFVPVPNVTAVLPTAQFNVTSNDPVWVYCGQTGHCQSGMVFAINPGDKFAAFQQAAMGNTSTSTQPSTSTSTTSSPAGASTTLPSSTSQEHRIIVGGDTLTYNPSNITAQPGDRVTFEFHVKNHTVTQSSFDSPCQKLSSTSTSFDSGFMPVSANATTFPTYTITQVNHCSQGMVFSVNSNETAGSAKTFEAFQAKAKQSGSNGGSSNSSGSATGKNGAGAVRLDGMGVAVGFAAVLFGLTL
ncbi:hypothetical protein BC826DRAFT_1074713 [Russula brevipes]|nr:hypothetical protein BC826DRAFT_1074713 [Russula brevipes]